MKSAIIFALVLLLSGATAAQNNPIFYGGAADGHSAGRNTPLAAANQGGGGGDGGGGGISGAGIAANQSGGVGDGSNTGIKASLPAVTNTGGVGDGSGGGIKSALPAVTNSGGPGDGYSRQATVPVLAANQRGGVGDGWSNDTFIGPFTPPVPLPHDFLSFTAKKAGEDAQLDWKMGNEKGIDRYVVERSSNAVTFVPIGEVLWREAAHSQYSFVDEQPLRGHNYYRIRVMSASGEQRTPVRLLVFDEIPTTLAMKLYPNPATTRINVALPGAWLGSNVVLNVYAANGILVLQQKLVPLSSVEVPLPMEALVPGVYTLQAATDTESLRERFVKR